MHTGGAYRGWNPQQAQELIDQQFHRQCLVLSNPQLVRVFLKIHLTDPPCAATAVRSIDEAPFSSFHRRLAIFSCGGPFCDGYILGIITIALGPLSRELGLSAQWQGMIAAASLAGMLAGGALFGHITDLIGRRLMYTLDLLVFVVASLGQIWVSSALGLLAIRLVLGVAVGADYPIVSALLAEFAPRRQRGMLLSGMVGAWWVGYTVSFIVGYLLSFGGDSTWRWMLASSAIPAALVMVMRVGTPESPRWLLSRGREKEAKELVRRYFGPEYQLEDEHRPVRSHYSDIFGGAYLGRTLFVCVFWTAQIIPTFGIFTFAPDFLRALGLPNPILGTAVMSLFFLAGIIPAVLVVDRIGRRPLLIVPFIVTGVALVVLAFVPRGYNLVISVVFIIFAMFNSGSGVLQWVYPTELFPTDVRATALGFATAVSRVGAALGTFLTPIGLQKLGAGNLMLAFAGVCVVGWVVSARYAPETCGLSLQEAASTEILSR